MGAAPVWLPGLEALLAEAEYLKCDPLRLAGADPVWRRMARTVLMGRAEAARHRRQPA